MEVSNEELYEQLQEVKKELKIHNKIFQNFDGRIQENHKRINSLEKDKSYLNDKIDELLNITRPLAEFMHEEVIKRRKE